MEKIFLWVDEKTQNTYTYPQNSHTIILAGVDARYYYIKDPLKKEKNIPVLKEKIEKSFDSMGRQLILLKRKQK